MGEMRRGRGDGAHAKALRALRRRGEIDRMNGIYRMGGKLCKLPFWTTLHCKRWKSFIFGKILGSEFGELVNVSELRGT